MVDASSCDLSMPLFCLFYQLRKVSVEGSTVFVKFSASPFHLLRFLLYVLWDSFDVRMELEKCYSHSYIPTPELHWLKGLLDGTAVS